MASTRPAAPGTPLCPAGLWPQPHCCPQIPHGFLLGQLQPGASRGGCGTQTRKPSTTLPPGPTPGPLPWRAAGPETTSSPSEEAKPSDALRAQVNQCVDSGGSAPEGPTSRISLWEEDKATGRPPQVVGSEGGSTCHGVGAGTCPTALKNIGTSVPRPREENPAARVTGLSSDPSPVQTPDGNRCERGLADTWDPEQKPPDPREP